MTQIPVLFGSKNGWYEVYRERFCHLRYVYGRFYWNLDNDNIKCPCGTMYETSYAIEFARLMEKMLRDVIEKEAEYDLKPSFADVPK